MVRYRQFGRTGWRVSEIGFGGARIGGLLDHDLGGATSLRALDASYDAGINFYDTADMYSQGESEVLIGKAFRSKRDKVFIATKGGYCLPKSRKLIQLVKPFAKPIVRALGLRRNVVSAALSGPIPQNFSPAYLRNAVEVSLRRLQSDYIDLYQLHSPPREELSGGQLHGALELLGRLKTEGKIREYGIALDSVYDAAHCANMDGIASLQLPFGLMDLQALDGAFAMASKKQYGIIARGCFGGGALKQSLTESNLREVEPQWKRALEIRHLAEQMQRSSLEAALQFSLGIDCISVTILGMRTPEHIAANMQFYAAKPLSDDEKSKLLLRDAPNGSVGAASA